MLYQVHLAWEEFELTTLVVIGIICLGSCKSNNHAFTTTTAPRINGLKEKFEDTKGVIRGRISKKGIQYIGQKIKLQQDNRRSTNTTQKITTFWNRSEQIL